MNIWKFLRVYRFQLIVFFLLAIPLLFLMHENIGRALFILISLLVWLILTIKTRSVVLSSLLYILITLPFNLTYQLPTHVLFFNTEPYVNGIYSNYLVPTFSILDLGLVLFIISYIYEYSFKHTKVIIQKYLVYLIPFVLFVLLGSIFRLDLNSLVNGGRLILGILSLLFLIDYFKTQKHPNLYKYVILISMASVLIQGILGAVQFAGGSSLGFSFLGESQVVSGMQGSSFVTLNNEVFLRAYGTFPHPNILGGFFVMNVLLGIYLYPKLKDFYKKLSILLVILSVIFVTLTFSRISILLVLMILFVTLVYKLCKGKLLSFAPILLIERFANLISGNDTSWTDRINLVRSSFSVIENNLLLGTGSGNFTKGMAENVPITSNGVLLVQPVHNVLLLMVAELGIFGTLLYVLLLGKILISNISKMNGFKWLVICVLIVIGCFDHYLFSLPQGMVVGGIMMILLNIDTR
jgi:O-antigen ligase